MCKIRLSKGIKTTVNIDIYNHGLRIVAPDDDTILDLEPLQGLWTQAQYLKLTDHSRRLLEFADGYLEVLPMPTDRHQVISRFLLLAPFAFVHQFGGTVLYAPLRLQIRPGKFREPDLLLVRDAHDARRQNRFWFGADLVVEVVSPDDPDRDTQVKRVDYAEAHIPESWLVNPVDETITVLTLVGDAYSEHGVFRRGQQASSALLHGFALSVAKVFDAV
jgi:Uma2 family endonuclease